MAHATTKNCPKTNQPAIHFQRRKQSTARAHPGHALRSTSIPVWRKRAEYTNKQTGPLGGGRSGAGSERRTSYRTIRILCDGSPLGGALVRDVAAFEGHEWYDALPRVSDLCFSVESDAGTYACRGGHSLPSGIKSGRVSRITLEVAVKQLGHPAQLFREARAARRQ